MTWGIGENKEAALKAAGEEAQAVPTPNRSYVARSPEPGEDPNKNREELTKLLMRLLRRGIK